MSEGLERHRRAHRVSSEDGVLRMRPSSSLLLVVSAVLLLSSSPLHGFVSRNARCVLSDRHRRCSRRVGHFGLRVRPVSSSASDDDYEEEDRVHLPDESEVPLTLDELQDLTIPQLKQQLRLRGLKLSGRKEELIQRLLRVSGAPVVGDQDEDEDQDDVEYEDVTEFLDPEDRGKSFKSVGGPRNGAKNGQEVTGADDSSDSSTSAEVWGSEARIVDDYEGRRIVVDSLSQTIVEFTGSNQSTVQAYCVATRDALKPFLAGGTNGTKTTSASSDAQTRLEQIQEQREKASRRPVQWEDESGLDEGDETGKYKNILHRDFSDWGVYTQTGAQLSASEVQGVLLLSDVYGPFTDDTRALADKIAFECQPVVVMVPDLFRGNAWTGSTDGKNNEGERYESWRAKHSDLRVNVDIRAAAACLRERYGVSSVVVWGTCYGGGRALEAASGWFPGRNIHDVDGSVGPPPVRPMAAIAWYPTRYNATELFGPDNLGNSDDASGEKRQMAVMSVFAGNDEIPGATTDDAAFLNDLLAQDDRVKDHVVKVFPGQDHGFAHRGIGRDHSSDPFELFVDEEFGGAGRVSVGNGDAEVACLLSTAFMETYSRVFLPTVGPPISRDSHEADWRVLDMKDLSFTDSRDVRKEIEEDEEKFVEEPLGGLRIDPTDDSQEEELKKLLRTMQDPGADNGPYAIEDGDDLPTIYAKLTASDDNFQLF